MSTHQDLLFDASPTPVVEVARDGTITAMNRAARRVFGIVSDRLIGKPVLGMIVPEDRDRTKRLFLRVLDGHASEWTSRFQGGEKGARVQRVRAVPASENGEVDRILVFTSDLASSQAPPEYAQLHGLLEHLPGQFTAILDSKGRIRTSTGMTRTHFLDDRSLVGEPYTALLDQAEDGARLIEQMLETIKSRDHWMGTVWHERVDNVSFPVRTFASPYLDDTDGRILGALVVGRDVSVEHRWRARASRAERFAAIGEFAASIADEFGAGLERIVDELGADSTGAAEAARLRAFAASVHELADDATGERAEVDPVAVARTVAAKFVERAVQSDVSIDVDTTGEIPPLLADGDQIGRVLEILIENAVDSLEGVGGGWVQIRLSTEPGVVVIRVRDSGTPSAEDTLHRAFEPFFTTRPGRTGLGLSVARALVQAHEGQIWSDVDESDHVEFAIQLPLETEPAGRFRPEPLNLSQNRTILVVDDEESVRLAMNRFLQKVGYEVLEAWSGRSALAQITGGRRPELVLTDLRMRDGSGFWLIGELERDFPDLLRRTVILTGDPDHEEVSRLVETTGCPVVGKPVELPELLELLDEVTRRD